LAFNGKEGIHLAGRISQIKNWESRPSGNKLRISQAKKAVKPKSEMWKAENSPLK
jgi:hypothetical protein